MRNLILILIAGTQFIFAQVNLNIGGNNSFNHNSGNINISQSNCISDEENIINQRIEDYQPSLKTHGHTIKALALKINKLKTTTKEKNIRCKNKVKGLINIFGHKIDFGYAKCDEFFR